MGKWTRRALITTGVLAGGALVVGIAIRPGHRSPKLRGLVAQDDEALVNAWVKIGADNTVTAIVPHSEMGQGAQTALAQMLADELDADWDQVRILEAPAHEEYANYALGKGFLLGDADVPAALVGTVDGAFLKISQAMDLQITGGSLSVRATGQYGMRVAGAAARQMLLDAAAAEWGVDVATLTASKSTIRERSGSREAPFSAFARFAAELTPPAKPQLKSREEFNLIGQSVPRRDIPAKVDGSAQFGIDAEVEGMLVATSVRAPVFGSQVASLDDEQALAIDGVRQIVNLGDAVAVVADGYWPARQGLARLNVTWTAAADAIDSQEQIFQQFAEAIARGESGERDGVDRELGNVEAELAAAATVIEADYRVPYLAHATMEPMNCTAHVTDDACAVWIGSQNPLGVRGEVAAALDLDASAVTVHQHVMGGGFGRRATNDVAIQAAQISAEVGAPVKLIWSREEDIRQDWYRPAVASRFKAGLSPDGQVTAWQNGYVDKHEPAEAPLVPYAFANQLVFHVASPTHVPFGPWRSVDHSQHGFFTEAFVDELAAGAKQDPYEFRRGLLSNAPRHRKVLETAAQAAGWGRDPKVPGQGRGIALQESFGSIVAQVVDVEVAAGKVKVKRVVCAIDPGFAVSPDGLTAQMESGIIYGLTAALYGEISIENGRVKQSNFHDYEMLRIDEAPMIETHIVTSDNAPGGAGEPGTPGVAPALANAIFDATGTRIRELPVKKYDLQFSIAEPDEVV